MDILVKFSRPIGWEIVDLTDALAELLERPVDLVKTNTLKSQLRKQILAQVVYVDGTREPA